MAKGSSIIKLSRKKAHRTALLKNLATSLVLNEKIVTTKSKAKALQPFFESIVSKAIAADDNGKRTVKRLIKSKQAQQKLLEDFSKRFAKRKGGYTRIEKVSWRQGDDAQLVSISLTEEKTHTNNKNTTATKPARKSKTSNQISTAKKDQK